MIIGGVQRSSTIDFPGRLSCVVFLRGCDLDCFYCHNRPLIGRPRTMGSASYSHSEPGGMSESELFAFLSKRRGFLSGVVISGGEPTLQAGLMQFMQSIKGMGFAVKLDTNGQHPSAVEKLIACGLPDYCAVDVKALPGDCASVTGSAFAYSRAKETIELLSAAGVAYEVRTTLYPGMTVDMLHELLSGFAPAPVWRLNYFRMPESFRECDEERLVLPALVPASIANALDRLKTVQPGLKP